MGIRTAYGLDAGAPGPRLSQHCASHFPTASFFHDPHTRASLPLSQHVGCHSIAQILRTVRVSVKILPWFRARCRRQLYECISQRGHFSEQDAVVVLLCVRLFFTW